MVDGKIGFYPSTKRRRQLIKYIKASSIASFKEQARGKM